MNNLTLGLEIPLSVFNQKSSKPKTSKHPLVTSICFPYSRIERKSFQNIANIEAVILKGVSVKTSRKYKSRKGVWDVYYGRGKWAPSLTRNSDRAEER